MNRQQLQEADDRIDALCEFIEEWWALNTILPGYINDSVDVDKEGCFV